MGSLTKFKQKSVAAQLRHCTRDFECNEKKLNTKKASTGGRDNGERNKVQAVSRS